MLFIVCPICAPKKLLILLVQKKLEENVDEIDQLLQPFLQTKKITFRV